MTFPRPFLLAATLSALCFHAPASASTPTLENIAQWGVIKAADGPEGRPLPLAGNWMAAGIFGPERFVELIEDGHHVLLTFTGVNSQFMRAYIADNEMHRDRLEAMFETYYRPGLEYARKHRLPIAIREWNWSSMPQAYQEFTAAAEGREVSLEEDVRLISGGKPDKNSIDPFGPVDVWREWGTFWTGNEMMRRIQEVYPDPPMVVFLDNNEGARAGAGQVPNDYPRFRKFVQEHMTERPGETAEQLKNRAVQEAWMQRYGTMYAAARGAMVEPAWRENVRFVAYNTLWDTGYIGQGGRPREGVWFDNEKGWSYWKRDDGSMPEIYDNDWQPGKADYRLWSMQHESMNYYSVQDLIFSEAPNYHYGAIIWDGAMASQVWRNRIATSIPFLLCLPWTAVGLRPL